MQSFQRCVSCLAATMLIAGSLYAQTGSVTPVAGNGTVGFSGDNGPATSAQLQDPSDIAVDTQGNFFIADRTNNRVRKVTITTGVITTVAGSGITGWDWNGGPSANFGSLNHPSSLVLDAAGNVYIADIGDFGTGRIRKVDTGTGQVTTISVTGNLSGLVSLALDSQGNLYFDEDGGHLIRKLSVDSGAITAVAGTGSAGFSGDGGPATSAQIHSPGHLVVDANGSVYFADTANHRIRKVSSSGIITTVAGNGTAGFSGDRGPATSAALNSPQGVAVDSNGNVYIADSGNQRVRLVSAASDTITTIVGADCGTPTVQKPVSLVAPPSQNFIYVVDDAGNRIWKVIGTPDSGLALSSISPASALVNTNVTVSLGGSGFMSAANVAGSCGSDEMRVNVSGAGVTVTNVSVRSDAALTAAFRIAPDATPGPRDVTVAVGTSTTNAMTFTITSTVQPTPTLTSLTPSTGTPSSTFAIVFAGTNFVAGATNVAVEGGGISITDIQVSGPASLTATLTISPDAALGAHNVAVVTAGGTSNALPLTVVPAGLTFTYGLPQILNPAQQVPIDVGLESPSADTVTAKLTLTFKPNANNSSDDPNVMFINSEASMRTVDLTFEPNSGTAQLSLPDGVLQAGTVAGTIELKMTDVHVAGTPVTPAGDSFDVQIPRLPPVITAVSIKNRAASGFDVEVTGYSDSREIQSATFTFGAASGAKLLTVELHPDVTHVFSDYYGAPASTDAGSAFVYLQHFIIKQGDVNAVASVTVTLTNAQGSSEPKTAR